MNSILDYYPGNTLLHRINPILKLLIAFAVCAVCFITQSHFVVFGMLALTVLVAFIYSAGKWAVSVIKSLLIFSLILFVVQTLTIGSGNILLELPLGIRITDKGLLFSLLFVLRLITSALPLALMLRFTRGIELANALHKNLRVPFKYAFALSSAVRFIPDFADEMKEIIEVQTARGVELDTKGVFKKLKLILPLCVPLLLNSVRKAETAAISAELRGVNLRR
jgi:energy-coupling factor transport system permease protein